MLYISIATMFKKPKKEPERDKSPVQTKSNSTKKKQKSDGIDHRQAWGPVPGVKKVTITVLFCGTGEFPHPYVLPRMLCMIMVPGHVKICFSFCVVKGHIIV